MLKQVDKINVQLIKRIMIGKKVVVETEKTNNLLPIIPTDKINELNELIYAGAKLICDTIGAHQRNPNWNTKPGWDIRLEGQVKKLLQARKLRNEKKNLGICWNERTKTKQ